MKNYLALLACLLLLSASKPVRAEWIPPFDLYNCTDRSPLIVEAVVDLTGKLTQARAIKGTLTTDTISLSENEGSYLRALASAMNATGPMHAVLFLDDSGKTNPHLSGYAGLVGLRDDGVYRFIGPYSSMYDISSPAIIYVKPPDYTPATFLLAVSKTVSAIGERDRLLALPRSPGRTQLLLDYLLRQDSTYPLPPGSPGYRIPMLSRLPIIGRLFRQINSAPWQIVALAVRPAQPGDTKIVLQELHRMTQRNDTRAQAVQIHLLDFLGIIDPGQAAFPEVARLTGREVPPQVRAAAIKALPSIDPYRATALFARMLSPDDPALPDLLSALHPDISPNKKASSVARPSRHFFGYPAGFANCHPKTSPKTSGPANN